MADGTVEKVVNGSDEDKRVLSFWQLFTYSMGELGVSLSPALVFGWLIYFYTGRPMGDAPDAPRLILVSAWGIAFLGLLGRVVDSLADPLVGFYSDKWRFKWGRRIPWVVFGTPFLAAFSILTWFPPNGEGMGEAWFTIFGLAVTPNFVWIALNLSGFWFFYTVVVAPYLSLLPEITPYNKERIKVSEGMAYMDVVGMIIGSIVLGLILDAYGNGLDMGFFQFKNGYEVAGVIIALVFSLTFYIGVAMVRERPYDASKAVPFNFYQAMMSSFRNPAFPPYVMAVSMLRLGLDIVVASLPFMVINLMGHSEALAGATQGIIVIVAALLFPMTSALAGRHGKKKIFIVGMLWFAAGLFFMGFFFHAPFLGWVVAAVLKIFGVTLSHGWVQLSHCFVVLILSSFPISVSLVLPRAMIADIMDHDEKLTGYRREAMYNGMEGLITKFAAGMAAFIVPLLNDYLGASATRPAGVVTGVFLSAFFLVLGWYAFRPYVIEK